MTNPETTQSPASDDFSNLDVEGEAGLDTADTSSSDSDPSDGQEAEQPNIQSAEFQTFDSDANPDLKDVDVSELNRLQNIQIAVTAELGRAQIPIQNLMSVSEGTVIELDEQVDSLVKLVSQGVTLASGEVVVVDGNFAIRVVEVYGNN